MSTPSDFAPSVSFSVGLSDDDDTPNEKNGGRNEPGREAYADIIYF